MPEAVIIEAVRAPFGRRDGAYRDLRPDSLLARVLQGLMERAGVEMSTVEDVITGCVTQAGEQGANVGRLASLLAGFPPQVPALTLDRMCGSSQQAVHFAAQAITAGDVTFAIGAGVESMTRAPMFSNIGGGFETLNPDLLAEYEIVHQGESAERIAEKWGLSRLELDEFSAESHLRAYRAWQAGCYSEPVPMPGLDSDLRPNPGWQPCCHSELVPMPGLDPEGNPIILDHDEGIRTSIDMEKMAQLPTVFRPEEEGVVTAGNASQISDGASAVLVAEREAAQAEGLRPRARFLARVAVGDDPTMQLTGVIPATKMALQRAGLTMADLDWVEINEAFASVVLAWAREFDPDMEKVNPWGGAIAHGHPLGATGAGLMAKMLAGLEATEGQLGLQVMCIGHGMSTATVLERV